MSLRSGLPLATCLRLNPLLLSCYASRHDRGFRVLCRLKCCKRNNHVNFSLAKYTKTRSPVCTIVTNKAAFNGSQRFFSNVVLTLGLTLRAKDPDVDDRGGLWECGWWKKRRSRTSKMWPPLRSPAHIP